MSEPRATDKSERNLFVALAAIVVVVLIVVGWRHWRAKKRAQTRKAKPTMVVSAPAKVDLPEPKVAAPEELALEIWIRDPEAIAAKVMPHLVGPQAPKSMIPTFAQMLKNGLPPEAQADVDELDFTKPLGWAILEASSESSRFVVAATVKDPAKAAKVVDAYAVREGAAKERSDKLAIDLYKGAKTGRYLGLVGNQVMLSSDRPALEAAAARLASGLALAATQPHDVVARAPQSWVAGPFVRWVERTWSEWVAPQIGGAQSGPAKTLFDEVSAKAKETWPGAQDLEIAADVGDQTAVATATLHATAGSALSNVLATYPKRTPDALLDVPRDALGGIAFQMPGTWLDTVRKFMVTAPPGVEIPHELKTRTEQLFGQLGSVIEGEILVASVVDPPQTGGPGTKLMRFKVRDEEAAKKAVRELVTFLVAGPPGAAAPPPTPIAIEGGSGEAYELTPAPQPGAPPMPTVGIAWLVRAGHVYIARDSLPKARVVRFASPNPDDHLAADAQMKARVASLPQQVALALFMAPFRADTPLPAAMKIPPLPQAITLSVEPTPVGLNVQARLDLDLTLQMLAPLLLQPAPMPPGAVPPDAAGGMPPPGMGAPPPGMGAPKPQGPATPPSPPPAIPPAPTGYVLPIPKRPTAD